MTERAAKPGDGLRRDDSHGWHYVDGRGWHRVYGRRRTSNHAGGAGVGA